MICVSRSFNMVRKSLLICLRTIERHKRGSCEAKSNSLCFSTPSPPRQLSRNSQGAGSRRASTLPPSGFSQDPLVSAPTVLEDSWEALPWPAASITTPIALQRLRSHTRPRRPIHHPAWPSLMLPCLEVNSSRLEFPTRRILKAWTSLLHHIRTRPSLSLCSMLIPPPGCRSRLMPCMASTRPSHTAARPGLMPCIPIGLFDPHVSPFLPVFFISFVHPFPFCAIFHWFPPLRYMDRWYCASMLPLSRTLFSTYIHPYQTLTTYLLMCSHLVFDGITHAWHLLLAFIVLELYLVTDVRIYPLNRTSWHWHDGDCEQLWRTEFGGIWYSAKWFRSARWRDRIGLWLDPLPFSLGST